MITVILTHWKRWQTLRLQVMALVNQTVKPDRIIVLGNGCDPPRAAAEAVDEASRLACVDLDFVLSSINTRYHGRFALGLLAQTRYVALFDDDTVPGRRWFENCIDHLECGRLGRDPRSAILGTSGVLLLGDDYDHNERVGWNGRQSAEPEFVDLVGHAWFLRTWILSELWSERPRTFETGEDIALSCLAWMNRRIPTAVPPHPPDDPELWGSDWTIGKTVGTDHNCSAQVTDRSKRNDLVRYYIERGYVPVVRRAT